MLALIEDHLFPFSSLQWLEKIDIGAVKLKNASNTFGNVISHPTRAADLENQKVKLHEVNRKTVLVFRKTATGELDYWVIGSVDFFKIHCIKQINKSTCLISLQPP